MKKLFAILLAFLMLLTLAACGKEQPNNSDDNKETHAVETPINTPNGDDADGTEENENNNETDDHELDTPEITDDVQGGDTSDDPQGNDDTSDDPQGDDTTENGISSEFKDALDSYEAFIDEYIEFMKEYAESDNPLSMLEEYSEMLIQYTETMQALDDLGNEEMSEAEAIYYVEVMTRINQKLLELV